MDSNASHPIQRIRVIGPESSGKTTLCQALAQHFGEPWVPEYARSILEQRRGQSPPSASLYTQSDLDPFLKKQCQAEDEAAKRAERFLFCDTDPITFWVWSTLVYGNVPETIERTVQQRIYAFTFLLAPDLPWQPDPLREAPTQEQRDTIFTCYQNKLNSMGERYEVIRGSERLESVIAVLSRHERNTTPKE